MDKGIGYNRKNSVPGSVDALFFLFLYVFSLFYYNMSRASPYGPNL